VNNFNLFNPDIFRFPEAGILILFKILFLVGNFFAIIFLLVVAKQVFSMNHIVHDSNDFIFIKTFVFILIFVAVSLFLISLGIL